MFAVKKKHVSGIMKSRYGNGKFDDGGKTIDPAQYLDPDLDVCNITESNYLLQEDDNCNARFAKKIFDKIVILNGGINFFFYFYHFSAFFSSLGSGSVTGLFRSVIRIRQGCGSG